MQDEDFRVALITGAGSGMGRAAAALMHEGGWSLLLVDLDAEKLEIAAVGFRSSLAVETLAGDLADPSFIGQLSEELAKRPVSAVIHCAGISPAMGSPERILEVNLASSIALVDVLLETITDDASIVLFASTAGHNVAGAFDQQIVKAIEQRDVKLLHRLATGPEIAYAISKRGVQLLVRERALRFGKRNARINSLSPGIIDTPMGRTEVMRYPVTKKIIESSPLARLASPCEVSAVAAFLCSPGASFVTGTDVLVDGGSLTVGSHRMVD